MIPLTELLLFDTSVLVHLLREDMVGQRIKIDYKLEIRPERPLICGVTVGEIVALAKQWNWAKIESMLSRKFFVNL